MILGGFLFVWSVKYIQAEWPQIFVGLLSVFSTAMGFALLIMPLDLHEWSHIRLTPLFFASTPPKTACFSCRKSKASL